MAQITVNATADSVLHQYQVAASTTWASCVGQATGTDAIENQGSNVRMVIAYHPADNLYTQCRRTGLVFDTSSIPTGATITGVSLKIYVRAVNTPSSLSIAFTSYLGSRTTPAVADYDQFGTTELATRVLFSDLSLSAYNTFVLNSNAYSLINLGTGATSAIGVRTSADIDASLAGNSENNIYADYNSGNPAQLIIDYTEPTTTSTSTSSSTSTTSTSTSITTTSTSTTSTSSSTSTTTSSSTSTSITTTSTSTTIPFHFSLDSDAPKLSFSIDNQTTNFEIDHADMGDEL